MVASYYELHTNAEHGGSLDRELAQSLLKLGEVHALLQDHAKAIKTFQKASSVAWLADEARSDAEYQRVVFDASLKIAASELARGNIDDAEAATKAGRGQIKLLEPLAKESDLFEARATVETQTGRILEHRGEFLKAAAGQHKAAQFFRASGTTAAEQNAALSLTLAGQASDQAGEAKKTIKRFEEAIAIWEELRNHWPDIPDYLEGLATASISLTNVQRDLGQHSEETYRQATTAFDALVDARPEIPRYRFNRATASLNLAGLLNQSAPGRAGLANEAYGHAKDAQEEFIRLAGEYPETTAYTDAVAASRSVIGEILRNAGDLDVAHDEFSRAADYYKRRLEVEPLPRYRHLFAVNVSGLGIVNAIRGSGEGVPIPDSTESLELAAESWQAAITEMAPLLATPSGKSVPQYLDDAAWMHLHLADVLMQLGKKDEALTHAKSAVQLRAGLTSPQHDWNQAWLRTHSRVDEIRDANEAVRLAALATTSAPGNADYQNTLAAAHLAAGDLEKAEAALMVAGKSRKAASPADQFVRSMIERRKGNSEEADTILAAAIKLADETAPLNPKLLRLRIEAKVASQSPAE